MYSNWYYRFVHETNFWSTFLNEKCVFWFNIFFDLLYSPGPSVNEVQRTIISRSSSSKQPRRAEVYDIDQLVHESGPWQRPYWGPLYLVPGRQKCEELRMKKKATFGQWKKWIQTGEINWSKSTCVFAVWSSGWRVSLLLSSTVCTSAWITLTDWNHHFKCITVSSSK